MPRSNTLSSSLVIMSTEFKTGDLVLCKVGAFAPWPAVVFPQRFLSPDVYRKRKQNCVAVCFFNDPTYYWEYIHKLKPLTKEGIKKFLTQDHKHTTQEDIIGAYKQADRYNSLRSFMRSKFKSEGRLIEFNDEIDKNGEVETNEDPFVGKGKDKRNIKEFEHIPTNNKIMKKESHIIKEIVPSDEKQNFINSSKSNHKIKAKLDRSRRLEISLLFRRRIQRNLIQRDSPPTIDNINETHKLLSKIMENLDNEPTFFDLETLKKSKIHKLLKVVKSNPKLAEFHPACQEILQHWADIILEIKKEKNESKKL